MLREDKNVPPSFKIFCVLWAVTILAPQIYFPAPSILAGHPWKVELLLSFVLAFSLLSYYPRQSEFPAKPINSHIIIWILLPICLLVAWSTFSVLYSNSIQSSLHHSLVWGNYLVFFFTSLQILNQKQLFRKSLTVLSLTIVTIALQSIVEHIFSAQITEIYGFRFARYAEINAALLPLFLACVIKANSKHLWRYSFLLVTVWLAVLFSMSRAALLSTLTGITVFVALRFLSKITFKEKKKITFAVCGLAFVVCSIQFFPVRFENEAQTSITRLTSNKTNDPDNNVKTNVRFLFASVGIEMFKNNFLLGVGADNFGLEFNNYRKTYSSNKENAGISVQQEALLPERAHNEYLQILAELGVIGGAIFFCFLTGILVISFKHLSILKPVPENILKHAAFAGIIAFLFSSAFSSFSFRLMQNGIIFFFLLALLLKDTVQTESGKTSVVARFFVSKAFIFLAIIMCCGLFTFSVFKAASQYTVYKAERTTDFLSSEKRFKNAIYLDNANASAHYLFGLRLIGERKYAESAGQLRKAIDKGLNTSPIYSLLATAQILNNTPELAEKTLEEAVEIFPYSVFIRVRYGCILESNQKSGDAQKQFEIANHLNPKQAKTWKTFIKKGAAIANQDSLSDKNAVGIDSLYPYQAVSLIMLEREILHPEEIPLLKKSSHLSF